MLKKQLKYTKGGKLNGKPHSKGGIPIEAEGGEYVIKKILLIVKQSLIWNI